MIGRPINDTTCLGQITDDVIELAARDDASVCEWAGRYRTVTALIAAIRALPQRDDTGDPADGPKVTACTPPQRLRLPAPDPNCFERAAWFLAVAEKIDPRPLRQLSTVDTDGGRHTFPVENGQPVVLDPWVSRNALRGGLFRNAPEPVRITPKEAIDWIADIAEEAARKMRGGRELVWRARDAMIGMLDGFEMDADDIAEIAVVLALAEREARAFGPAGVTVVLTVAEVLGELDDDAHRNARRRPGWPIGRYRVRPSPATIAAARVTERVGSRVAAAGVRAYLASMGIPPTLLEELEIELRREGLTMGALTRAPKPGTIEAMAGDAVKTKAA